MNNSIELFVEHFSLYTKRKMADTTLRLRSTSHTQSYFFYLNIENILKISNKISIVAVKLYYSQNKSKNSHLDFLGLTVQIVKSRLQNRQLNLFKIS